MPTALVHTCVRVRDVDASLRFYRALGFEERGRLNFASAYNRLWGMPHPPLHDPVAVARVIDRSIVGCVDANVTVELHGRYTRGATVVDLHRYLDRPVNAQVAVTLDADRFWDRMIAAVTALGSGTT